MWTRAGLKANALAIFKANYWKTVLIAFIFAIIGGIGAGSTFGSSSSADSEIVEEYSSMSQMTEQDMEVLFGVLAIALVIIIVVLVIAIAISAFVFEPLIVGCDRYFVVNHYQPADIGEVGFGFKTNYLNVVKTMFLTKLFVALWTLLLIVPGIIKSYAYMMVPYILADNPDIDSKEARRLSEQMMNGHKWDAFVLSLSFIGWFILRAIPVVGFFVGLFWVNPYYSQTLSELYIALRDGGMSVPYCGVDNSINNVFNGQNNAKQNMNNTFNGQQGYQQNQNMNANGTPYYGQQGYQQPQQNQNMNTNSTPYYGQQGYQQNQNMNTNSTPFYGQQQTAVNTESTVDIETTVNADSTVNTETSANTETAADTTAQNNTYYSYNSQTGFDNSAVESSIDQETFKTDSSFDQSNTENADDTNKTE